jgi:hypothetical protein
LSISPLRCEPPVEKDRPPRRITSGPHQKLVESTRGGLRRSRDRCRSPTRSADAAYYLANR